MHATSLGRMQALRIVSSYKEHLYIWLSKASHGQPTDVFALGCIFAEMLTVGRRRSLEDFREYRKAKDEGHGQQAFRINLNGVLRPLEQSSKG